MNGWTDSRCLPRSYIWNRDFKHPNQNISHNDVLLCRFMTDESHPTKFNFQCPKYGCITGIKRSADFQGQDFMNYVMMSIMQEDSIITLWLRTDIYIYIYIHFFFPRHQQLIRRRFSLDRLGYIDRDVISYRVRHLIWSTFKDLIKFCFSFIDITFMNMTKKSNSLSRNITTVRFHASRFRSSKYSLKLSSIFLFRHT